MGRRGGEGRGGGEEEGRGGEGRGRRRGGEGSREGRGMCVGLLTCPVEVLTAMPMDLARDELRMFFNVQTAVSRSWAILLVR